MGSVKLVLAGLYVAAVFGVMTASAAQAVTIISSSATGTVRDNGGNGTPDVVFTSVLQVFHPFNTDDRGIVEFDISGQTMSVGQALLTLTREGTSGVGLPIQLFGYGGAGANGAVDIADFNLGTLVTGFNVPATLGVSIDVTAFINAQIGLSSNFVGFNLRSAITDPPVQVNFVPSNPTTTPLPALELGDATTTLPEPGTLAILGLGLLGLGFTGWRRRR